MIRKATSRDVARIIELWKELMEYHQHMDAEAFKLKKNAESLFKNYLIKKIKDKKSIVLVAENESQTIAYLIGYIHNEPPIYVNEVFGYVSDGYVRKKYRGTGIMSKMIDDVSKFFKKQNVKELSAKVFIRNEKGLGAWKNIGFKIGSYNIFKKIR